MVVVFGAPILKKKELEKVQKNAARFITNNYDYTEFNGTNVKGALDSDSYQCHYLKPLVHSFS